MFEKRLTDLQKAIQNSKLDAVVALPGANLRYLTGVNFHPSERPLALFVRAAGAPVLVIPKLEHAKLRDVMPYEIECFPWDDAGGPIDAFMYALEALALPKQSVLGVEALGMRYQEMELIRQFAPGLAFDEADNVFAAVRLKKDETEIEQIRKAIDISQAALDKCLKVIKPGMTERAIGTILRLEIIIGGGDVGFILVQGGEGSAQPHGDISDRAVNPGDLLLIDFGALVAGYPADITRTFVMGGAEPAPRVREIYDLVKAANAAGCAACRPGATPEEIDRITRAVITEGGYGEYFFHRTGHGLGLEVHEPPYINEGNTIPLEVGNVFTIEPGIYIPGLGGVRIEDDIVITKDGAESLTTYPREWSVVGVQPC
ncbi:MAG: aminopeptidase P family protein [Anaerolineae bacterium]|nr:aminopeptidase P family protein [Anaerolineae bacterium]